MNMKQRILGTVIFCALFWCAFSNFEHVQAAANAKTLTNSGLVGWWMMDEGTSTIARDFSGNGNNATFSGTPVWSPGKKGKSLLFNGSNSVTTPDADVLDITTNITLSVWYKKTVGSGTNKWLVDKGNVNSSYAMFIEGGLKMRLVKPGSQDCTVTEPSEGVWHHAVATYDGSNMRVYVDGVLLNTCAATGAISTTATGIRIGAFEGNGYAFNGNIDDVRIYNRVLLPNEVIALYGTGQVTRKNVSNNGLVGHWSLDEGTSTLAHDFSGNSSNNFGTLSGFAMTGVTSNWTTSGKRGSSLDFDGTDDQVYGSIPAATFSGDFTIAAWFNHRAMTQWGAIFSNSVGTNETALMTMRDTTTQMGIMRVGVLDSGVFVDLGADHYNKWIYGVITRQGSNLAVYAYKDGRLISNTGTLSWTLNTDNEFYIGRHYSGGLYFNGKIDDVRVYNRALSLNEINTLYTQGGLTINHPQNDKLTNGLVGLWSFNGSDMNWTSASAGTSYDRSGNNNHGTLTSMSQSSTPASGVTGQALNFDGVNDYVISTNNLAISGNAEFTMCSWIKWNGAWSGDYPSFMGNNSTGATNQGLSFTVQSGRPAIDFWVNRFRANSALSIDTWYHICGTKTPGLISATSKLYVNGGLVAGAVEGSDTTPNITAAPAVIGRLDGSRWFKGIIDESRYYNRALTAAEVKQLYLMGK